MARLEAVQDRAKTQEILTGLVADIAALREMLTGIEQKINDFDRRAERTDDILILLLTEHSQGKVQEVLLDLEGEISLRNAEAKNLRKAEKRELLESWLRNLAALRQQAAFHGLQVPLRLVNEIEQAEKMVKKLEGNNDET